MSPSWLSTVHYRWLAVAWTLGILIACSVPSTTLPSVDPALGVDKIVHVGLFAVFGALWMRSLCPPTTPTTMSCLRRHGAFLVALGGAFAVTTEVYQHLLPIRRLGDPYDAAANGLGLAGSLLAYVLYTHRRDKAESSSH